MFFTLYHHLSSGGVTDTITQIVAECREQGIPTVFALSRRRLAMLLKKKHKIGCVGIFSYDGAEVGVVAMTYIQHFIVMM